MYSIFLMCTNNEGNVHKISKYFLSNVFYEIKNTVNGEVFCLFLLVVIMEVFFLARFWYDKYYKYKYNRTITCFSLLTQRRF